MDKTAQFLGDAKYSFTLWQRYKLSSKIVEHDPRLRRQIFGPLGAQLPATTHIKDLPLIAQRLKAEEGRQDGGGGGFGGTKKALIDRMIDRMMKPKTMTLLRRSLLPLLPDRADTKFPKNFPTLVFDVQDIFADVHYDSQFGWRVLKRPHADECLRDLAKRFELIVWSARPYPTAENLVAQWQIPVMGALHADHFSVLRPLRTLRSRLATMTSRASPTNGSSTGHGSTYYGPDFQRLGRDPKRLIILKPEPGEGLEEGPGKERGEKRGEGKWSLFRRNEIYVPKLDSAQIMEQHLLGEDDRVLPRLCAFLVEQAEAAPNGDLRARLDLVGRHDSDRFAAEKRADVRDSWSAFFRKVARNIGATGSFNRGITIPPS